jgi:hypothetical protein
MAKGLETFREHVKKQEKVILNNDELCDVLDRLIEHDETHADM